MNTRARVVRTKPTWVRKTRAGLSMREKEVVDVHTRKMRKKMRELSSRVQKRTAKLKQVQKRQDQLEKALTNIGKLLVQESNAIQKDHRSHRDSPTGRVTYSPQTHDAHWVANPDRETTEEEMQRELRWRELTRVIADLDKIVAPALGHDTMVTGFLNMGEVEAALASFGLPAEEAANAFRSLGQALNGIAHDAIWANEDRRSAPSDRNAVGANQPGERTWRTRRGRR